MSAIEEKLCLECYGTGVRMVDICRREKCFCQRFDYETLRIYRESDFYWEKDVPLRKDP